MRRTSLELFHFTMQHRASTFPLSPFLDAALMYRLWGRVIVPSLAPQILHVIGQSGAFEEPVSKQWAIPISTPYSPDSTFSSALYFISQVMGWITQGYADALVAGGFFQQQEADDFKDELYKSAGICGIYQTVCARKRITVD